MLVECEPSIKGGGDQPAKSRVKKNYHANKSFNRVAKLKFGIKVTIIFIIFSFNMRRPIRNVLLRKYIYPMQNNFFNFVCMK